MGTFCKSRIATFVGLSVSMCANAQVFEVEEIIVTAQKRVELIQDVSVSVTAYTGDQMRALGWNNTLDVSQQTPGLVTTSNTGDSANIALFSIRGVNQGDFAEGQEAPVAVYMDEVYLSSPGALGLPTFDIERIEVLRGPQGTLYGRNATGGLVSYVSKHPTRQFEGSVELRLAEYGTLGATTVLSGPLSDSMSGRFVYYHNENDGYVDNAIGEDKRNDDTQSLRAMLNVDFDNSTLLLIGRHTEVDTTGGVYHNRATKQASDGSGPIFCKAGDTDCGTGLTFGADGIPVDGGQNFFGGGSLFDPANGQIDDGIGGVHDGAFDFDSGVNRDNSSITAIYTHSIGDDIEITNIADFTRSDKVYREDDDSSQWNLVTYVATADVKQWSEEFRVNISGDDYEWVAGAYFLHIENDFSGAFAFPSDAYDPRFDASAETDTISGFTQVDYSINDALMVIFGIRYTQDKKDLAYQFTSDAFQDNSGWLYTGDVYTFDRRDPQVSGKLQIDYRTEDEQLWYLGINRGTKGGGFNTPSDGFALGTEEVIGYDPEELTSYEIGSKRTFNNRKGIFNASIFYYDYQDYQGFFFSGTTSQLINSEATFLGGELELFYSSDDGWDFVAGISLLDTEVNGQSNDGSTVIKDQDALLAPDLTINLLARREWQMGSGRMSAQISANHVGEQYFNLVNSEATAAGDYTLVDLRVSYFGKDDSWEGSIYLNNLTDEEPVTYGYDITDFGNYSIYVIGPPRWAGASIKYNF